jgi:hypothetical protein
VKSTAPRSRLVGPAVSVALLAFTGCGSDLGADVHLGEAAAIGDRSVTLEEVDEFAEDYCSLFGPVLEERGEKVPMGQVRTFAVSSIVEDELMEQFAEENGFEPTADYRRLVRTLDARAEELGIPERDRPTYVELTRRDAYAQTIRHLAGAEALEAEGVAVTDQGAVERGQELYRAWREERSDVSIDPRFGTLDENLTYVPSSQGLSVPVSDLARSGSAAQPDKAYLDGLPASQTCG